jgi:hypothetical protein
MRSPLCPNQWRTLLAPATQDCQALEPDERRSCCPKRRGMKPSKRNDIWGALCGEVGVDTIARAVIRSPSRDHASHPPAGKRMHFMKQPGQSLMARGFERQVAEILIRIICPLSSDQWRQRSHCSTATLLLASQSQSLKAKSVWCKGLNVLQLICATIDELYAVPSDNQSGGPNALQGKYSVFSRKRWSGRRESNPRH